MTTEQTRDQALAADGELSRLEHELTEAYGRVGAAEKELREANEAAWKARQAWARRETEVVHAWIAAQTAEAEEVA